MKASDSISTLVPGDQERPESVGRSATFLIVDDHPVVSFALQQLIDAEAGWRVTGKVVTAAEAIAFVRVHRPDIALVDLILPASSGFELLTWLHTQPAVRSVVYSVHPEDVYARRCLAAGAAGYVSKDAAVETLVDTIRWVLAGRASINGQVLDDSVPRFMQDSASGLESLSTRELEVLTLLGQGLSNRRIAQVLCRSDKTIESHRYRISKKLRIANGPELVHFAIQHCLASGTIAAAAGSSAAHESTS